MEKMLNEYLQFTSSSYLEKNDIFDLSELIKEIVNKYDNQNININILKNFINAKKLN